MARYKEIERRHPVGGNVERYSYYEKWWRFLKTLNRKLHCDAEFHLWLFPQKNWKQSLKEIFVPLCSLQWYFQWARMGATQKKCALIDEWMKKMWYTYTWSITWPYKVLPFSKIMTDLEGIVLRHRMTKNDRRWQTLYGIQETKQVNENSSSETEL